uniref:FAR1 domain-containing protein n=1 Tax=Chenopodium quinoa TaxID=63459 RepID=A0A803MJZ1_CHEQI
MISSEVAEDICVSLSYNEEGGIMDLINFEEGEGEGDGDIGELCPYEGGEGMDGDGGNMEGFGVVLGQSAYKTLKDGRKVKRAVTWKCECASLPDTRRRIGGTRLPRELEGEPIATKKSKKCGCETGMYASLKEHGKWEIVRRELKHEPHKVVASINNENLNFQVRKEDKSVEIEIRKNQNSSSSMTISRSKPFSGTCKMLYQLINNQHNQ